MTNAEYRKICLANIEADRDFFDTEAPAKIEQFRKGDCVLRLSDAAGHPIVGQTVRIVQQNHDFKYGANLFMLDEFPTEAENRAFRELFASHFNLATVPFYWDGLEPERGKPRFAADSPKVYRRPAPDLCMEYCREAGILPKLHCLVYDKFLPDWTPKRDEAAMLALYEERIAAIAARYAGKLYEVEVINELLSEQWWQTQSVVSERRDVLEWAFSLARKYFPTDTLVINDGNYLPEIATADYRHPYFLLLDAALARGVPIDKIGIQNHVYCGAERPQAETIRQDAVFFDTPRLRRGFDVLSALGKPLEITEVTIPTVGEGAEAEALQAELVQALYTLWFSVPALTGAVYWNSVEGTAYDFATWRENDCRAGFFRRDLTPKPAAERLRELFGRRWRTELSAVTDERGEVRFRGFYGAYTAEVRGARGAFGLHKGASGQAEVTI